ncbi:hypothetical protein [Halobacillus sp. B23F22_1]|uniref:hypothetical protein n=1 Tax=Halobacillus sp. B23F22_1 TaxID=3459514 RepID=UPI00373E7754
MPKSLVILLICLTFTLLSGCSHSTADSENEKDTVLIKVINNSDMEFHAMELQFYQDGELIASQGSTYADGSSISREENLEFHFNEEDFPSEGDTVMELITADEENKNRTIGNEVTVNWKESKEHTYEIQGNSFTTLSLLEKKD